MWVSYRKWGKVWQGTVHRGGWWWSECTLCCALHSKVLIRGTRSYLIVRELLCALAHSMLVWYTLRYILIYTLVYSDIFWYILCKTVSHSLSAFVLDKSNHSLRKGFCVSKNMEKIVRAPKAINWIVRGTVNVLENSGKYDGWMFFLRQCISC